MVKNFLFRRHSWNSFSNLNNSVRVGKSFSSETGDLINLITELADLDEIEEVSRKLTDEFEESRIEDLKVKTIIRQNKKGALLEFLFGATKGVGSSSTGFIPPTNTLEKKIEILQKSNDGLRSQVDSLQQRVIHLENQNLEKKGNLNVLSYTSKTLVETNLESQEYKILSIQNKAQNEFNFVTLEKIYEQYKI